MYGIAFIVAVISFCMYVQLVMNTGNTVRLLKRIEKRLEENDPSPPLD